MIRQCLSSFALILAVAWPQPGGAAPRSICYTVHPGDTTSRMAARLTGDARNRREPWFQVFDPVALKVIPKAQYGRIRAGWQACIAEERLGRVPLPLHQPAVVSARVGPTGPSITEKLRALVVAVGWWWVPLLFSATAPAWIIAQDYADRRLATSRTLERFGNTFVREFERPLIQQACDKAPLRSRVRVIPHRERLEVSLAPNAGRLYPNLSDHRKNVEYDVERVVTLLGDRRFVCGPLAARGAWVVIPFRLEASLNQKGRR